MNTKSSRWLYFSRELSNFSRVFFFLSNFFLILNSELKQYVDSIFIFIIPLNLIIIVIKQVVRKLSGLK